LLTLFRFNESLQVNWLREAVDFVPSLKITVVSDRDREYEYDAYITTNSLLQRAYPNRQWLGEQHWDILVCDEGHLWARGSSTSQSEQRRFLREVLLPNTATTFMLTATPLPTDIRFDFCNTILSLACEEVRQKWVAMVDAQPVKGLYTDDALAKLFAEWTNVPNAQKAAMLVPLMIQRTENTLIDGERVMYPYLGSM